MESVIEGMVTLYNIKDMCFEKACLVEYQTKLNV